MPRKFQIERDGAIIGHHDATTLRALLNAGALRLSDTYWHRSMREPLTLATLLIDKKKSQWLGKAALLVGMSALAAAACVTAKHFLQKGATTTAMALASTAADRAGPASDSLAGYEIRRGTAYMRGTLEAHSSEPPFPQTEVSELASHSRVAVLALDNHGEPFAIGAGVVIGDGTHAVCALRSVAGAEAIEIQFHDGSNERPATAIVDEETGVVILPLARPAVPLRMSPEPFAENDAVLVAGHVLSTNHAGTIAHVTKVEPGERHLFYQVDKNLPATSAGSAVINTSGDVAAILVNPKEGRALRTADVMYVLKHQRPSVITALREIDSSATAQPVQVASAAITDGNLIASLRNTSGSPIYSALLHVTYFATPPEAEEARELEARLRALAVQASLIEDTATAEARANRQALREVNARLEIVQKKLAAARLEAAQHPHRRDLQIVQCELSPGIPQTVELEVNAGTQWSAQVVVLDVDS